MNQNTRQKSKVNTDAVANQDEKHGETPDAGQNASPAGTGTQNPAAQGPKKLTRAERSQRNKLLRAQTEVAEIAASNKAPFKTLIIPATGEGEMLPAKLRRPSASTAKQTTAVANNRKAKHIRAEETGRPSEYTQEEADAICAWVAGGKSLNSYCKATGRGMPTVYKWLRERAEFLASYTQAHEDRADTLVDEMVEIADDSQHAESVEAVSAAKLRVETRKWIAMKLRASKYGDKVEVKQTGAVSIRIGLSAPNPAPLVIDSEAPPLLEPGKN